MTLGWDFEEKGRLKKCLHNCLPNLSTVRNSRCVDWMTVFVVLLDSHLFRLILYKETFTEGTHYKALTLRIVVDSAMNVLGMNEQKGLTTLTVSRPQTL